MFYFPASPVLLKLLYPRCIWSINTTEKVLYLTFDDGPDKVATSFVLDLLREYKAKGTFFCIGKNVVSNPDVYQRIIEEGHQVGNHTYSHLNGWKTPDAEYADDILKAKTVIDSPLFRPPYGRITGFQLNLLKEARFELQPVMWSVLSGDFDPDLSYEDCYLNVARNARAGSIVVFHDSSKSFDKLKYTLPLVLKHFTEKGYKFETIPL